MNFEKRSEVRYLLGIILQDISSDGHFVSCMREAIFNDVCADIEASVDYDFNSDDVRIAVARVLMRKFGID